jgi:hypothetical protein
MGVARDDHAPLISEAPAIGRPPMTDGGVDIWFNVAKRSK